MENHVRLVILSDSLSPDQIGERIGICGDESWKIGDKRKNTLILEKENGWLLKSKVDKSLDLEDHLESIKGLVVSREDKIKEISNTPNCWVQLSCAIYYKSEPPLCFEKEDIFWLNKIGASLDIDLYET